MITATFVRESPEVKLGISLQRVGGFVEITRIKEIGVIFAQTDLRVGNRLLMINNIDCTQMSAEEALVILKTTLGTITILADNSEVPTETAIVKAVPLPLATVTSPREMQPLHPPGKPAGGVWGTNQYIGNFTAGAALCGCLVFCLPGLLVLCCPCDERDAYKVDGQIYDAEGRYIGPEKCTAFVPKHMPMQR